MRSYRHSLGLLSRVFSWIGTFYVAAAVVLLALSLYGMWFFYNSHPVDGSTYITPDTEIIMSFLAPANWPAIATFAIALLSKGVVTSILWQQVSHVTRYVAEQQFLKAATIVVLKRLIFISLFSFIIDAVFTVSLSNLVQKVTEIFNRIPLSPDSNFKNVFGPHLLYVTNWQDFIIPNFNNANSLFLALLCYIAIDAVKATVATDSELQEIKQEHSLIV
jgi:hypothetical protein